MYVYGIKYTDGEVTTYKTKELALIEKWYKKDRFMENIERCLYLVYSDNWNKDE